MTEIALLAGFHSLRRFNAVFAEVYGRAPSKITRGGRGGSDGSRSGRAKIKATHLIVGKDNNGEGSIGYFGPSRYETGRVMLRRVGESV
jgi:hypothetical protein